jgi:hypothetical protein
MRNTHCRQTIVFLAHEVALFFKDNISLFFYTYIYIIRQSVEKHNGFKVILIVKLLQKIKKERQPPGEKMEGYK